MVIPVSLHPACIQSQRRFTLRASLEGKIQCQKTESSACLDFGGEDRFVCISNLAGKLEKYRPEKPIPPSPSPPPKSTGLQHRGLLDQHQWGPVLRGGRLGTCGHMTVALQWSGTRRSFWKWGWGKSKDARMGPGGTSPASLSTFESSMGPSEERAPQSNSAGFK